MEHSEHLRINQIKDDSSNTLTSISNQLSLVQNSISTNKENSSSKIKTVIIEKVNSLSQNPLTKNDRTVEVEDKINDTLDDLDSLKEGIGTIELVLLITIMIHSLVSELSMRNWPSLRNA
jgi:hypothetical protein